MTPLPARLAANSVPANVVRYGGGARSGSRERERERDRRPGSRARRRFDESHIHAQHAGPQTARDWLAALNSFSQRIETIEK